MSILKKNIFGPEKSRIINKSKNTRIKNEEKKYRKMLNSKEYNTVETKKKIDTVYSTLDKAAKVGAIKKNKVNRKKSRLLKLFNKQIKQ